MEGDSKPLLFYSLPQIFSEKLNKSPENVSERFHIVPKISGRFRTFPNVSERREGPKLAKLLGNSRFSGFSPSPPLCDRPFPLILSYIYIYFYIYIIYKRIDTHRGRVQQQTPGEGSNFPLDANPLSVIHLACARPFRNVQKRPDVLRNGRKDTSPF